MLSLYSVSFSTDLSIAAGPPTTIIKERHATNIIAITIRNIEENKVTWTYTDILGDDDDAVMIYI